jgi:hypothetical protein
MTPGLKKVAFGKRFGGPNIWSHSRFPTVYVTIRNILVFGISGNGDRLKVLKPWWRVLRLGEPNSRVAVVCGITALFPIVTQALWACLMHIAHLRVLIWNQHNFAPSASYSHMLSYNAILWVWSTANQSINHCIYCYSLLSMSRIISESHWWSQ